MTGPPTPSRLSAINLLSLRGPEIVAIDGFLASAAWKPFGLPPQVAP